MYYLLKIQYFIYRRFRRFLDGLGSQTTRGGHHLPQNMNDKQAFDLALEFKMSLLDSLIDKYDYIVCNNITEDNHAGVFGYFAASAFKQIAEQNTLIK